jgi:hypothetical protein
MPIVIDTLATVAALCTAVIFGTDVLAAVVLRPTFAEIDDHALVQITGRSHRFGNSRLPLPGVLSVVAAAATAVAAFIAGSTAAGVLAVIGLLMLGVWLVLFNRISLPINKVLIAAADAGDTPANARELQDRWESIITLRAVLQGLALAAFCVAIATAAA